MRWPERRSLPLAVAGVWLILCLVLVSGDALASSARMAQARPVTSSAMPSAAMPQMLDCLPCARCYVAPAPVAVGVVEPAGTDEPAWRVQDPALPYTTRDPDRGGGPSRLPVRIAYCRWLD